MDILQLDLTNKACLSLTLLTPFSMKLSEEIVEWSMAPILLRPALIFGLLWCPKRRHLPTSLILPPSFWGTLPIKMRRWLMKYVSLVLFSFPAPLPFLSHPVVCPPFLNSRERWGR